MDVQNPTDTNPTPQRPDSPSVTSGGKGLLALALVGALAAGGLGVYAFMRSGGKPAPSPGSIALVGKADKAIQAARACVDAGEFTKAEGILGEALSAMPDHQDLNICYGELLVSRREFAKAYRAYQHAVAIGPRSPALDFTAGAVAAQAEQPERAIEHYAAAQVADPKNPQIPLYLAQMQLKQGQLDEAEKNLLLSARLQPEQAITWGTLAEIALRQNTPSIALQHVEKARQLEPENLIWRSLHARALKRLNRPEDALQILAGLGDAQKFDPAVLPILGECLGMLSRNAEAAALYVSASDADASNGLLAFDAAVWLERAGKKNEAKKYAQRAAMLNIANADRLVERLGED